MGGHLTVLDLPVLGDAPRFGLADAVRLAGELYGRTGTARALPSERDQNFLIEGNDGCFVLKIAHAHESSDMLDAQRRVLEHLAVADLPTPRVLSLRDGGVFGSVTGVDGQEHRVWALTCLPGRPLATLRHRGAGLVEDVGRIVGWLDRGLWTFDHPAVHRDFYWDLARARAAVDELRPLVGDATLGMAIDRVTATYDREVAPLESSLRRGTIHGDLNDHNVLVSRAGVAPHWHLTGIVDFGDMVHSFLVADLAVAAAYLVLDAADPLMTVRQLVKGYHVAFPLTEEELHVLFGLACLRLSASVCIAASQQRERPDNAYLSVSQEAIGRTLPRLAAIPYGLARAVSRETAGLEPVAASTTVRLWLAAHASDFAPVLGVDLRAGGSTALNLGVASSLVSGHAAENAEERLTPRIFGAIRDAGARVGIGRYDEPRLLYTAPFFDAPYACGERRTIHIGLDVFAEAGTPVHAPLDGMVHAVRDNASPQDYGPVVILRHVADGDLVFYTLYGHLSRDSLPALQIGRQIARGERFASLGEARENGGWTPHLHLQLITDTLDLGCDFPGVAPASQRVLWRSFSPTPAVLVGLPDELSTPDASASAAANLANRRRRISDNLSVAYQSPVKIERGWMQYLYDDSGRRYLDAYNNVPHVGHCHPRVVSAGQKQMAVLNTNTRYLSDLLNEYADRLTATLPEPLRSDGVAFFVNSASEANEVALRLARAHTRQRDVIVLEGAYHGITTGLIDISPYKHAGTGGSGAPEWVHVAPLPDDYRGLYRRGDPQAGKRYAWHVGELCSGIAAQGRRIAAFVAESAPSVGGQIVFPPGYLEEACGYVREAGGVCVADEVQTGLGRIGTHFWAFEAQGVVPDIVVMGKPLGNGHPIGAVVVRRNIAQSFANGMEFFSTFGGNHVSCAIGLAVLDVVRDAGLQAHALRVGERMWRALERLQERYPLVGDVRGSGFFLGVELVRDRETLEPAGEEAAYLVNRMREEGILLGTDGPYHNVVKIRPPMPFDDANADQLTATLERIIGDELSW